MSGELPALAALLLAAQGGDSPLSYGRIKESLRRRVAQDPMDAVIGTVIGGSFLFYLAERDVNPKVKSPWDAFVFISTCMSVGYHDVFAHSPAGKAIATAVMAFGPALSARVLDAPGDEADLTPQMLKTQEIIAEKLEAILAELRRQPLTRS